MSKDRVSKCRHPGLALPLIALQYHEVKVNVEFRDASDCFFAGHCNEGDEASDNWTKDWSVLESMPSMKNASLFVDYIYLDTDERRRFAQSSHEYLESRVKEQHECNQIEIDAFTNNLAVSIITPLLLVGTPMPATSSNCWELLKLTLPSSRRDAQVAERSLGYGKNVSRCTNGQSASKCANALSARIGSTTKWRCGTRKSPLQFTGDESISSNGGVQKIKLSLNHPCSELIWVVLRDAHTDDVPADSTVPGKQWFNFSDKTAYSAVKEFSVGAAGGMAKPAIYAYTGEGENPVVTAKIQLNGHDRFSEREGIYFGIVQPYQAHENVPSAGVNVYSFALKPEEHQPSGTCNMSRIDNATLVLNLKTGMGSSKVKIFAINYNVNECVEKLHADNTSALLSGKHLGSLQPDLVWRKPVASIWNTSKCNITRCGKPLTALTTTSLWKHCEGTRLIAVPNGKKVRDWAIRRRLPNSALVRIWKRLRDCKVMGLRSLANSYEGLRYSPAQDESLETTMAPCDEWWTVNYR